MQSLLNRRSLFCPGWKPLMMLMQSLLTWLEAITEERLKIEPKALKGMDPARLPSSPKTSTINKGEEDFG